MADIKQITLPNGSVYNIKDEVARNAISNLNSFNIAVVQSLPTQNIDSHTIYFLGNPPSVVGEAAVGSAYVTEENNIYEEWIYVNNRWELVGTTAVNLDDYVPTSRKVNGKELSNDITIGAGDIDFDTQGSGIIPLDEAIHGLVNGLSSVAWSGSYNDLSDTPTLAQSDWEETDNTDLSYIENKPSIKASDGENSIIEGNITDPWYSNRYTIYITGSGHNFTYTTEDTIPAATTALQLQQLILVDGSSYRAIEALDVTNNTISINFDYVAQTNREVYIYKIQANYAAGSNSHAEGDKTLASSNRAHAEGYLTRATGSATHAEGMNTIASGSTAHAEGNNTKASGMYSHSEGWSTNASGNATHAEGYKTTASGTYSHSEGLNTTATHKSQHVFGEYNILDQSAATYARRGTFVEIVGNGAADESRSNARTLDWSGNEVLTGKLTVGQGPVNNMDVTTKQYVDNAIPTNVSSFTNDAGYLTLATLPIYDGSVI